MREKKVLFPDNSGTLADMDAINLFCLKIDHREW